MKNGILKTTFLSIALGCSFTIAQANQLWNNFTAGNMQDKGGLVLNPNDPGGSSSGGGYDEKKGIEGFSKIDQDEGGGNDPKAIKILRNLVNDFDNCEVFVQNLDQESLKMDNQNGLPFVVIMQGNYSFNFWFGEDGVKIFVGNNELFFNYPANMTNAEKSLLRALDSKSRGTGGMNSPIPENEKNALKVLFQKSL